MISYYNKVLLIKRYDPLVKWLRHGPFTAVTWVQIPYGSLYGGLAQLGEHLPYKQEVTGSSPVSSIVRDYRRRGSLFLCKKNEQAKLLFYRFKS